MTALTPDLPKSPAQQAISNTYHHVKPYYHCNITASFLGKTVESKTSYCVTIHPGIEHFMPPDLLRHLSGHEVISQHTILFFSCLIKTFMPTILALGLSRHPSCP